MNKSLMQKQMHFGFKLIAPESSCHWKKRMHPANYVASALDREQGVLQVEYCLVVFLHPRRRVNYVYMCAVRL